ncbi:MAG: hypothetical protein ACE5G5_03705 [Candidatus Methylomirabilales bacterium]
MALWRLSLVVLAALVLTVMNSGAGATPRASLAVCLAPPAFDLGVGKLYFCPPSDRG